MTPLALRRASLVILAAFVLSLALPAVCVLAGDAAPPPAEPGPPPESGPGPNALTGGSGAGSGFLAQMFSGGIIGIMCTLSIIATSVIMVALGIEHMFIVKRETLAPPELVASLESLIEEGDLEQAMAICQGNDSFLAKCIEGGLSKLDQGEDKVMEAMEAAGAEKATKMRIKLGYINLMAVLAPMLGLYGTVLGMIQSFQMIAMSSGTPKPSELADGIQLALWTTAEGLTVAIPALAIYYYFKNKLDGLLNEVGRIAEELMSGFLGGGGGGEEEEAAEG